MIQTLFFNVLAALGIEYSQFLIGLLVAHVMLGVIGVIASFMVAFMLIKPEIPRLALLRAAWSAFLMYALSWYVGGWYYWKYYGTPKSADGYVFPRGRIVEGDFPWAHYIFTESKEHAFIFLPFAALALALLLHYKSDALSIDSLLKKRVIALALVIATLGVIITLSGILMSGAAR